jgi:hypothetical protein
MSTPTLELTNNPCKFCNMNPSDGGGEVGMKRKKLMPMMLTTNVGANTLGFVHKALVKVYSAEDIECLLDEKDAEIRRLQRALYKACANWADAEIKYEQLDSQVFSFGVASPKKLAWETMSTKCRTMAERFGEGK